MEGVKIPMQALVEQLEGLRKAHGEDAYVRARMALAVDLIGKPNGEVFLRNAFPDLDLDAVKAVKAAEVGKAPTIVDLTAEVMRKQMPNMVSQAQFDIFMSAFEALRVTMDSYFGGNSDQAEQARKGLDQLFELAAKSRDLAQQVSELPEDQRSPQAQAFVKPPVQFDEVERHKKLMADLDGLSSLGALQRWYDENKSAIWDVRDKRLRDTIFDRIRSIRITLQGQESN